MVPLSSEYGAQKGTQRKECTYPVLVHSCRATSSHIRQSRPDSGLGVQRNVLKRFIFSHLHSEADWGAPVTSPVLSCKAGKVRFRDVVRSIFSVILRVLFHPD